MQRACVATNHHRRPSHYSDYLSDRAGNQRSQSADIPMVIPQVMIPIGLSIMALMVAVRILTGGERDVSNGSGH